MATCRPAEPAGDVRWQVFRFGIPSMARSLEHLPFDGGTTFGGLRSSVGPMLIFVGIGSLILVIVVGASA